MGMTSHFIRSEDLEGGGGLPPSYYLVSSPKKYIKMRTFGPNLQIIHQRLVSSLCLRIFVDLEA